MWKMRVREADTLGPFTQQTPARETPSTGWRQGCSRAGGAGLRVQFFPSTNQAGVSSSAAELGMIGQVRNGAVAGTGGLVGGQGPGPDTERKS